MPPDEFTGDRRSNVEVLVRLDALHEDVGDMKSALKELTIAINRLAIVEERQTQTTAAMERAFKALRGVEDRLHKLEMQSVLNKKANKWVDMGIGGLVAASVMFVGKKVGLL